MQAGKFTIRTIETCRFGLDGGAMFGVVPKNLWSKAYHPGDEQNRIPMAARVLLVEWEDKKLLIDTGNGHTMNEKLKAIYAIDNTVYSLEQGLAEKGIDPTQITDVVFTHLHFDHAGGATTLVNGEVVPTFPHATYYVQKEHLAWARNPTEKDRASFFAHHWEPLVANGMLVEVDGEGDIFEGISVHPLFGHSKAMQMVRIRDNNTTIVFPADLMPTSAHVPIPYVMGYDNFPLTTIEEKRRWLPRICEEGWIVCFEHDAFTPAATILHTDKGFRCGERIEV